MKIALRVLAVVCVLWAVFVPMLPTELPPPIGLWWWGATKEADDILARTNAPIVIGTTDTVTISRSSLALLTLRAKEPLRQQNLARGFLWASSAFAFVAGISLYFLGRRQMDQRGKIAEPNGPANGSQPIRSETSSTSSAAGSRR